jgi:hypothetical protein
MKINIHLWHPNMSNTNQPTPPGAWRGPWVFGVPLEGWQETENGWAGEVRRQRPSWYSGCDGQSPPRALLLPGTSWGGGGTFCSTKKEWKEQRSFGLHQLHVFGRIWIWTSCSFFVRHEPVNPRYHHPLTSLCLSTSACSSATRHVRWG